MGTKIHYTSFSCLRLSQQNIIYIKNTQVLYFSLFMWVVSHYMQISQQCGGVHWRRTGWPRTCPWSHYCWWTEPAPLTFRDLGKDPRRFPPSNFLVAVVGTDVEMKTSAFLNLAAFAAELTKFTTTTFLTSWRESSLSCIAIQRKGWTVLVCEYVEKSPSSALSGEKASVRGVDIWLPMGWILPRVQPHAWACMEVMGFGASQVEPKDGTTITARRNRPGWRDQLGKIVSFTCYLVHYCWRGLYNPGSSAP